MKTITTIILFLTATFCSAQAPSNDCGENALTIDACGTTFSITQAQMSNATEDEFCNVGGSCPIIYVNGTGYENFDCNDATGNTAGDDFSGSIENSVWWTFTPLETCNYSITIDITNCCCKDKGSTNAAQYQIFDASASLPGGTIQNILATNSGVTGSHLETVLVTSGNPVYVLIDGLNGTDCDISVSIQPTISCTGCVLALPIELVSYVVSCNKVSWATLNEVNNDYFILEVSKNGYHWNHVRKVGGNGTSSILRQYFLNVDSSIGDNYYRLTQVDYDGTREILETLFINCGELKEYDYYNILGQKVSKYYPGFKIRR